MRHRGWLTLLLISPFAVIVLGLQLAATITAVGAVQAGVGVLRDSPAALDRGLRGLTTAATLSDTIWNSLPARLLHSNPLLLGGVDDVAAGAHAARAASAALEPAGELAEISRGLDGRPALIDGHGVRTERIPDLAEPLQGVQSALASTQESLDAIPSSGPVGRPLGELARSAETLASQLARVNAAALLALPDLPDALGATEPKRYLVCALNDAEVFASGGAPLSAVMVEVVKGQVSAPISGQLESKLSPDNPSIRWDYAAGPPWLRPAKRYPFVNSNFHPDFRTAALDMQRSWAALGYPQVDGVITVDLKAVATLLDWTGPVQAPGHGEVGADSLIPTVLVDAYREFDTPAGVLERHARNDALVSALATHLWKPSNALPALRGALQAMPARHIQVAFPTPGISAAVASVDADGALGPGPGDMLGAFSQSAPNKLSIFQQRAIDQEVRLDAVGGAHVTRRVRITNAVPEGLSGHADRTHGYVALRARMRVAHRVPLAATGLRISTGSSAALVPLAGTGPFPDDRGGAVMWQGHETAPRETTTVTLTYDLPAGTFRPGSYELWADPQPLTIPTTLSVRITAAPGVPLGTGAGWSVTDGVLTWTGDLVAQRHLKVG